MSGLQGFGELLLTKSTGRFPGDSAKSFVKRLEGSESTFASGFFHGALLRHLDERLSVPHA